MRRRCVAADDDDGGDARRAVEVVESTIRYVRRVAREMANGADGSIATMVMMDGLGCDRFGGGGVRRVRA